jgi:hypothetical protein
MVDGYGELRVASDEESTIDEPVGLSCKGIPRSSNACVDV